MSDVTLILSQIEMGDEVAAERLLPVVYEELRKLAKRRLARERPDQTLQATALVHEAYIRLVDVDQTQHWKSRAHFFAAAAEAMRRILIERARRRARCRARMGGRFAETTDLVDAKKSDLDLLALDDVLRKLHGHDPRAAELVKLRFFGGLTRHEAADVLGVSVATADNDWAYARSWLRVELGEGIAQGVKLHGELR